MKTLLLQDRSDREMGHQSFQEASLLSRLAGTQQIHIQRLSPKKKGGFPYIPFRVGYRNGGYSLSNTWLHTTSLAILTSRSRWPFSGLTPGDIPQIHFFLFHCSTHYLPSPSLPSCHSGRIKGDGDQWLAMVKIFYMVMMYGIWKKYFICMYENRITKSIKIV
jgi:hypothetical protein